MADKTILEMGQSIALQARLKVPISLFGTSSKNASIILDSIKKAARRAHREYNWTQLMSPFSFTVDYGKSSFDLGPNFDRIVDDTVWADSNQRPADGPIGYDEWQMIDHELTAPYSNCFSLENAKRTVESPYARIHVFSIADGNTFSFYWISKQHVYQGVGRFADEFTSNSDRTVIDDEVVERLATAYTLKILGMSYSNEMAEYADMINERIARDRGSDRINMNHRGVNANGPRGRAWWLRRYRNDPVAVNIPMWGRN